MTTLEVAGAVIPVSKELKSLGVILDSRLTFGAHVKAVAKACNYHIWSLGHIRPLISTEMAQTLACSLVGAKLDYCNAVLYGAPAKSIVVLQRIQNNLARVVQQAPKYTHVTPVLRKLHWLPVKQRITFKLAVLTYKVRSTSNPSYLSSLLSGQTTASHMTLRSARRSTLHVDHTRTEYGARAFHVAAPTIWNSLPIEIVLAPSVNVFKTRLKTFLYKTAFDC